MQARRVVSHFAERGLAGRAVRKEPRPLDDVDQHQVVGEIRGAAARQQVWPRRPDQQHINRADQEHPGQKRSAVVRLASRRPLRTSCDCSGQHPKGADEPGLEYDAEPGEDIGGDGRRSHRRRDSGRKPQTHRVTRVLISDSGSQRMPACIAYFSRPCCSEPQSAPACPP
jgi:hypothetical protein